MYVYIRTEPNLWTVGFYNPDGTFEPESDYNSAEEAANRVAYLNGSICQITKGQLQKVLRDYNFTDSEISGIVEDIFNGDV